VHVDKLFGMNPFQDLLPSKNERLEKYQNISDWWLENQLNATATKCEWTFKSLLTKPKYITFR
jgi:hypothetical protein